MSTVFDRYGYNFDSSKFGDASNLSEGAKNTLELIANNTPGLVQWQIDDLKVGSPVRTDYYKNPTDSNTTLMLSTTNSIKLTANTIMNANTSDSVGGGWSNTVISVGPPVVWSNVFVSSAEIAAANALFASASNLIINLNSFRSHTDNISGVTVVTSPDVPSYDVAIGFGQMNMMTLTKTDGTPQNTVPILGSFTSLFINDILSANNTQLAQYNTALSVGATSTLMQEVSNYANSTSLIINTRKSHDTTFFNNSVQVMKDIGFLQQFSNMGSTQKYLVMNMVGTESLINKLSANT